MIVYIVMCALGEMASYLPLAHGFGGFATRFVDPALGFAVGYTYLAKYLVVTPNQLTAAALVMQLWVPRDRVNPGIFITILLLLIIGINYFGVALFGEFEFYLSSLKVIIIIGLIILCICLSAGAGNEGPIGFKYWNEPGAMTPYIAEGAWGRFLALLSCFVIAFFAYSGCELVCMTVAESKNPRRTIPRAVKLTFYRIVLFYVVLVFLLGMLLPYDSKELAFANKSTVGAAASPFVVAIQLAGIKILPGLFNGCILVFVISAANSDLYIASRALFGLGMEGYAPKIVLWTNSRGVPVASLFISVCFCFLAYLNISGSSAVVFGYFVNMVTVFGLLTWCSILYTHICFIKCCAAQSVDRNKLAFKSPGGSIASWFALAFCSIVCLFKGFDSIAGTFNAAEFVTSYIGVPIYFGMIAYYKIRYQTKRVKPHAADLLSGRAAIDKMEQEYNEYLRQAALKPKPWYRRTLEYIF